MIQVTGVNAGRRWATLLSASLVLMLAAGVSAWADELHGFCENPACSDNGTITPVGTGGLNNGFGFWDSSSGSGDWKVAILVPYYSLNHNNPPPAPSESFILNETGGNNLTNVAANLVNASPWTSNFLTGYLGLSPSNKNPFGAFAVGPDDNTALGFYVYVADFKQTTLPGAPGTPLLKLSNSSSPILAGMEITAFLISAGQTTPTANSAVLQATGTSGTNHAQSTPEPQTLVLLVLGLSMFATGQRLRSRHF